MDEVVQRQEGEAHKGMVIKNNQHRDWADLPSDLVGHIMGKLYWSDRIRMSAVCKSWLRVPQHGIPHVDQLPWIMGLQQISPWIMRLRRGRGQLHSRCKLLDTAFNKSYSLEERAIFDGATFQDSRYGWVLFQKEPEDAFSYCFFLYSPFTREVIELPKLELYDHTLYIYKKKVASFYLTSTSSDCVVFNLHRFKTNVIQISTCSPGDETWMTLKFDTADLGLPVDTTYLNGSFYCIFSEGQLGAFNVSRQEWTILAKSGPQSFAIKLIAVPDFLCQMHSRDKLFKFDFSKKEWVEQRNTQITDPARRCICGSAPILRETSEIANKKFHLYAYLRDPRNRLKPVYCCDEIWIDPPINGSWRKADLIRHV